MIYLVIAGAIVVFIILIIYYYNKIIVLENQVENAKAQIEVQLRRRYDLIPNLVETVKGYVKHEKSIFLEIAKERANLMKGSLNERLRSSDRVSKLLSRIFAIAERYPKLKASRNFLELQEELTNTENKIAYSRQFYNDAVLVYNNAVETFPGNIFAKIFGKKVKEYLEVSEKVKKEVEVKF